MNLFATILTYAAPSANYRGESEQNRSMIQKITRGRHEYTIVSPEAMRNALRETLRKYGEPCNRERLDNEEQLAVLFQDYPWPEKYADDFLFGYMVADRSQIPEPVQKERGLVLKRDSVVRMNMAVSLEPYRHDTVFTQSPLTKVNPKAPWQNANSSALLHRETAYTAFQYPFALNLGDFGFDDGKHGVTRKQWFTSLLRAISELNDVAGNHARSYFEMAPASIVVRLTPSLVAGYQTYGFQADGGFPEVVKGILAGDYPGEEFLLGGTIVREVLSEETQAKLKTAGVRLHRMAANALDEAARMGCGKGFLPEKGA
ncbi:MAG: type I-B CRISPR-associated protein Cas7/Cst2/DevR [Bryobacteraceae bacterium]